MPRQLEPTYRDALVKSWYFTLHHKLLWILGAMAVLLGQFGLGNFLGTFWTFITEGKVSLLPWLPEHFSLPLLSPLLTWQLAALLIMLCALVVLIIVMATCAQGAVIMAAVRYFSGKRTHLGEAWHAGARHFWRLIAVNMVQQIILLFTSSAILGFWRDFSHTDAAGVIMLVLALTIGLFIALITSILSIYTAAYVVDKEYTLSEAVGAAYELFKDHVLVSLEVSILLLILSIVPALFIGLATYVAFVPALPFILVGAAQQDIATAAAGIVVAQGTFAVLVALIGGAFNAFTIAAWVYCYRVMGKKGIPSRFLHHTKKLLRREAPGRGRVMRGRVS